MLTESRPQRWRAVARFGKELSLLVLGHSLNQIRASYADCFLSDLFTDETRRVCDGITFESWVGLPDRGYWVDKGKLEIPGTKAVA